jgi:hypothetical protein
MSAAAVSGAGAAPATPALTVRTSIEPQPARFGEHIAARIEVLADTRRVAPGSVVVVPGLAPLVVLGSQRSDSADANVSRVVVSVAVVCDADTCLPLSGPRSVRPGSVLVRARGRDGKAIAAHAAWPAVRIVSRLTAADLGPAEPPFRIPSQALGATYRVAPGRLESVLFAGAALLALAALALVGSVFRSRRRIARTPAPLTLAEAIARVRRAGGEDVTARREALEVLARTLEPAGSDGPAAAARALAWGRTQPAPEAMEAVAAQAEGAEHGS